MELLEYWSAAIAALAFLSHLLAKARGGRPVIPAAVTVPALPVPRRLDRSTEPRGTA